jgi:hypothetical protein
MLFVVSSSKVWGWLAKCQTFLGFCLFVCYLRFLFIHTYKRLLNSVTHQESSRKFRIRFQPNNQEEPTAVAYACACHLSRFFTLHDADRQGQDDDHPPSCTISIKQLAIAVLDPQNSKWPSGGLFREKTTFVLL